MENAASFTPAIVEFIRSVGIPITAAEITEPTILPGVTLVHGGIVYDPERLGYPGDLLHEAGHLAVKSPEDREATHHSAGHDPAEEMMAMAWAWAAGKKLGIPGSVIFHEEGYKKSDSGYLVDQFEAGQWFGVPMLQVYGMSAEPHQAANFGREPYPAMTKWLRD